MKFDAPGERATGSRLASESALALLASMLFLLALAPAQPFAKELGVCESGAVRDVLAGSLILPHYSPGNIVQAPPMFWWAAALAVRLFGWNEFALRAPSILAVALTAATLYAWLASSIGRRCAVWSMLPLLAAQYSADAARQPRMDALLMLFLTVAIVSLERALSPSVSDSSVPPRERRASGVVHRWMLMGCAALAMAAAVLTKGPIGIILPGLTLVIFFAIRRRLAAVLRLDLVLTFAAAVGFAAIWYLAALDVGGREFFEIQIARGLFGRFLGAAVGMVADCHHPFYYFIPGLVSGFFPWSLFYPALAILLWRHGPDTPAPITSALCWFIAVLGFFTISSGKCLVYILPLFPALAAMTGWLIATSTSRLPDSDPARRWFDRASIAIGAGVLAIVAGLAILVFSGLGDTLAPYLHHSDRQFWKMFSAASRAASPYVNAWAALWLLGGVIALRSARRRDALTQSVAVAIVAASGTLFWYGFLNPALASEQTLKPFAAVIDRTLPAGVPLAYIGKPDCDLAFYSGHTVGSVRNFQCDEPSQAAYFILWQDHLKDLSASQSGCLVPIGQSAPVDSHGARILMIEKK